MARLGTQKKTEFASRTKNNVRKLQEIILYSTKYALDILF